VIAAIVALGCIIVICVVATLWMLLATFPT
jgi:hypothetical protein